MKYNFIQNCGTLFLCSLALFCHQSKEVPTEEERNPALSQSPPGRDLSIPPELRLKHYREWSRYPPNSRPLGADAPDLFDLPGYGGHRFGGIDIQPPGNTGIKNGSLYLPFTVKVGYPGTFHFETILYTKGDKPCMRTSIQAVFQKQGEARFEFIFFGKTILDYCPRGPYHIKGVLGRRVATPEEQAQAAQEGKAPLEPPVTPLRGTFKLPGVETGRLSNRPWNSKIKRERIKRLLDEIARKNVDK